jgi:hypothetical protein
VYKELEKLENKSIVYPDYYLQPFHAYDKGNLCWQVRASQGGPYGWLCGEKLRCCDSLILRTLPGTRCVCTEVVFPRIYPKGVSTTLGQTYQGINLVSLVAQLSAMPLQGSMSSYSRFMHLTSNLIATVLQTRANDSFLMWK